jgi:hypothetical protein
VADLLTFIRDTYHWDFSFIWLVHDLDLEFVANFLDTIHSGLIRQAGLIRQGGVDTLCWNPSSQKVFEVKSSYKMLLSTTPSSFPWKSLWKPKSAN